MKKHLGAWLIEPLIAPRQIMIMHAHGAGKPHRLQLRPITLILLLLVLLGLAAFTGSFGFFSTASEASRIRLQAMQLQRSESRLGEAQAELALKQSQLIGLQSELREQRQNIEQLNQRLNMFEEILKSQKMSSGVRILKAEVSWQGQGALTYNLVLVKGGSHPRQASGKLRMTARGLQGQEVILHLGGKTAELSYLLKTHTFLQGSVKWLHDWRPDRILITHLSRRGSIRDETEIPIGGGGT